MNNNLLHVIESNNLYGLADKNDIEVVECVYNRIKPLISGKFIVIKDRMAGILDKHGKFLLYPQPHRLYAFAQIDIFCYKVGDHKVCFTFINSNSFYLNVDNIKYDEKLQIINVWKDGELKIYNYNFVQVQTGHEQIEPTQQKKGNSRFYLGKKNGKWGVFRIERQTKYKLKISIVFEAVYDCSEDALLSLCSTCKKNYTNYSVSSDIMQYDEKLQIINVWKNRELKFYNYSFVQLQTDYEQIEQTKIRKGSSSFYLGTKNRKCGTFRIARTLKNEIKFISVLETIYNNSEDALLALKDLKLKMTKHIESQWNANE